MNEKLTVFTPTFNRREYLVKCYESLKKQTNKDFLWMIIDDGSTDNTAEDVARWQKYDNGFRIEYYYKENGGLHTGYNEAIKNADTELMVCIDSDDYMPNDAVKKIIDFWSANGSDKIAGIAGLDIFENGDNVGDLLPDVKHVNLIDLLVNRYHIHTGDIKLVVRTDLYKSVAPMPTLNNEKNFNPHYMHLQISKKYDFLVLNEPLCVIEYQECGLTNNIFRQYLNSPNSFAETRRLYLSFDNIPLKFRIKTIIHYVSSCILSQQNPFYENGVLNNILITILVPAGWMLSRYIRKRGII